MILIEDEWVCPKCLEKKFKEIVNPAGYNYYGEDYGVMSDGKIKYVYVCENCNIGIAYYWDMGRKERKM